MLLSRLDNGQQQTDNLLWKKNKDFKELVYVCIAGHKKNKVSLSCHEAYQLNVVNAKFLDQLVLDV